MKFWDFFKKFLIFTGKEIYSFFLKLSLSILIIFIIGMSIIAIVSSKNSRKNEKKLWIYTFQCFWRYWG